LRRESATSMKNMGSTSTGERRRCHVCNAQDMKILYPLKHFNVLQCRRCGLVCTDLPVNRTKLEEMYGDPYFQERHQYFFKGPGEAPGEGPNIRDFQKGLSLIERYKQGGILLDVGCAIGVFLSLARDRGWECWGTDISPYAASYARESLGLNVFSGEVHEQQFPERFFDVITLWDVVEHFSDPSFQLHHLHRILKDDGILFLNTPNQEALLRLLAHVIFKSSRGRIVYPVEKLYHEFHLFYFTAHTLSLLLNKNGFSPVYVERKPIPLNKARAKPLERAAVRFLSLPEQLFHREYEILAIAKKVSF